MRPAGWLTGESVVVLGEIGEDTSPVQLPGLPHVSDVQQRGDIELGLGQIEGNLTIPVKYDW